MQTSAPRRRFIATPAPSHRAARQGGRGRPARRVGARRGRRAHAQGRPLLPGRHGRRASTSGSSSRRSTTRAATLFHSGAVEDGGKGPVEPGAHFYRSLQLDEHGNPINKRNAWAARSVAYVRLIPPGAADTVHYRLRDPRGRGRSHHAQGEGELPQVRLVEHAVGVRRRPRPAQCPRRSRSDYDDGRGCSPATHRRCRGKMKAIPDIPTTVMAEDTATLRVLPKGGACPGASSVAGARRCASAGTTTASACCCRAT